MSGRRLGRRGRELVANLLAFFEEEKNYGGPFIAVEAVRERVAAALKLNVSTVSSVSREVQQNLPVVSKKRVHKKPVTDIDEASKGAIRNVVYRMYENHEHITVDSLWLQLKEAELFNGCRRSLNTVLHRIGFAWKKDNPRRGLMELPDVVRKRFQFLKGYAKIKEENVFQFVFLDETWIFQNGSICRSWQNEDLRTVKSNRTDGRRYIVLHAGNVNGFIDGAELVFSSTTKKDDYHGEMNEANFLNWFENQLLKNLTEPSVIVLDNASYHSTVVHKTPTAAWRKAEIAEWLHNRGIVFETSSLKNDLLELVALNRPPKIFKVDQLAEQYGHRVLRLPPYHCLFNPIEQVWGISKNYYNRHIGRDGKSMANCLSMWKEALATITQGVWANCIRHCEDIIRQWWDREVRFDFQDIAPLIIAVDGDNSAKSDTDSDSSG